MKKNLFFTFCISCASIGAFAQNHTIHNNSTTIEITPGGIKSNHPSELSGLNQNLSIGKDALPNAPFAPGLNQANLAVGENALFTNASGSKNIAVGLNALKLNNNGGNNLAIGVDALSTNNEGVTNIAIGNNALKASANANQNIAIGMNALLNTTVGFRNISIGENSGSSTLGGYSNIGIGVNSMKTAIGYNNIALGEMSLGSADATANNLKANIVAIGNGAFGQTVFASYNSVAIGAMAGQSKTFTSRDVYIGAFAGAGVTVGGSNNNTAVGFEALQNNTFNNIAVGYESGKNASGNSNIFMGFRSGSSSTSNFNTLIGFESGMVLSDNYNTGVGFHALRGLVSGVWNASIGGFTFRNTVSAFRNSTVGAYSLSSSPLVAIANADSNVALGYATLYIDNATNTPFNISRNVAIGYEAGRWNTSLSDKLIIDNSRTTTPLIGGDFVANKVGINRLYTTVPTDPSTLQIGGGLGIARNSQLSLGLDSEAGKATIENNSSIPASGNIVMKTASVERVQITEIGHVVLSSVPVFADNTAAASLAIGTIYRTATGVMMVKY